MKNNFLYPLFYTILGGISVAVFTYFFLGTKPNQYDGISIEYYRSEINTSWLMDFTRSLYNIQQAEPSSDEFKPRNKIGYGENITLITFTIRNSGDTAYSDLTVRPDKFLSGYLKDQNGYQFINQTSKEIQIHILPNETATFAIMTETYFGRDVPATFLLDRKFVQVSSSLIDPYSIPQQIAVIADRHPFIAYILLVGGIIAWTLIPPAMINHLYRRDDINYISKNTSNDDFSRYIVAVNDIRINDQDRYETILKLTDARAKIADQGNSER